MVVCYSEHSFRVSLVKYWIWMSVYLFIGLAPPTHVHAGVVTDSSIELLWDRAEGDGHHYEALCMNCADTVMVWSYVCEYTSCVCLFLLLSDRSGWKSCGWPHTTQHLMEKMCLAATMLICHHQWNHHHHYETKVKLCTEDFEVNVFCYPLNNRYSNEGKIVRLLLCCVCLLGAEGSGH